MIPEYCKRCLHSETGACYPLKRFDIELCKRVGCRDTRRLFSANGKVANARRALDYRIGNPLEE